ncbi:MAG TPA: hypothetical protein VMG08_16975 [Allosphingosinicella sp.]|nr:hypothetical protein [Allosphingosinicella sp.]
MTRPGLILAVWLGIAGAAAPPPPAPVPASARAPIDGYDVARLYQFWRGWVEFNKGAAADALLAEPEAVDGERAFGEPLLRFTKHHDFGPFLTGEIRLYCREGADRRPVRATCHYRLRRAYVDHEAGPYRGDNPVARWTRESFDGARLVRRLREAGLGPETPWWSANLHRFFDVLPSPVPMLTANATVVRLDSRDCPAMARAIAALETSRVNWRLDLYGVGADSPVEPIAPHAVWTEFTLRILAERAGVTISGGGGRIERLAAPVLAAADACERARQRPAS